MRTVRRIAAIAAGSALALTGLTPSAQAAVNHGGGEVADWLSSQLTEGAYEGQYGVQYGPSIDLALSLAALGGHDAQVSAVRDRLAANINDYITGEAFGDSGSTYSGAVAKALTFAQRTGATPTDFGGVNLVTRTEAQVATEAPITGRIQDTSTYGDYAATIGQAWAAEGLGNAVSEKAPAVIDFLLDQQCAEGFFRQRFTQDKGAADQTCDGNNGAPHVDSTALAVLRLSGLQTKTAAVTEAIADARGWLAAAQAANGSWSDAETGANANSTGLAALALAGTADADQAAVWLRRHQAQVTPKCAVSSDAERGAIAANDAGYAALTANGIPDLAARDTIVIATSQAAGALAALPQVERRLILAAPTGFVRAGAKIRLRGYGITPGDAFCFSRSTWKSRNVSPGSLRIDRLVVTPAGTAVRGYRLSDGQGRQTTVAVNVLGALTLRPSVGFATREMSSTQSVVVGGLQPGENVKFTYRGRTVGSGKANDEGRFGAYFNVGRVAGEQTINAYGQFPGTRKGSVTFTVVR